MNASSPLLLGALVATLLASPLSAQTRASTSANTREIERTENAAAAAPVHDRLQVAPPDAVEHSVRKLAGAPVHGANGERLGTIKDFVIDKQTGEVVYAVVSSGGMLGVGNTLRLVPLDALRRATDGAEGFVVQLDRTAWNRAPALVEEAFDAGIIHHDEEQRRELHAYFDGDDRTPASRSTDAPDATTPRDRATTDTARVAVRSREAERAASPWIRASDLHEKEIHAAGREIGEIEDLTIDLKTKTAAAIVELDDDIFSDDLELLVPLTELTLAQATDEAVATTLTRQQFARFDPAHRARADADVVPTGRTSAEQNPDRDIDPALAAAVRSARQALDNHAELSRADIRVNTEGGQLVLRGRVRTERQKELAGDAVHEAASGIGLENYIVVDPR